MKKFNHFTSFSMTPQQVAGLTVVLGDHDIRQAGESQTHESRAARVVRHKGFSQETLVRGRTFLVEGAS